MYECVKSVRILGYVGPHFPAFGLNMERYGVSLCIQSECKKMRTGHFSRILCIHKTYVHMIYIYIYIYIFFLFIAAL